jgi:hypothetical protein
MEGILCPSCGHDQLGSANYCGLCGTPMANPASPAEAGSDHESARELLKILEITGAISSTLELQRVLDLVLTYAVDITQGQRGFLILRGPGGKLQIRAAHNMDLKELEGREYAISKHALGLALRRCRRSLPIC